MALEMAQLELLACAGDVLCVARPLSLPRMRLVLAVHVRKVAHPVVAHLVRHRLPLDIGDATRLVVQRPPRLGLVAHLLGQTIVHDLEDAHGRRPRLLLLLSSRRQARRRQQQRAVIYTRGQPLQPSSHGGEQRSPGLRETDERHGDLVAPRDGPGLAHKARQSVLSSRRPDERERIHRGVACSWGGSGHSRTTR